MSRPRKVSRAMLPPLNSARPATYASPRGLSGFSRQHESGEAEGAVVAGERRLQRADQAQRAVDQGMMALQLRTRLPAGAAAKVLRQSNRGGEREHAAEKVIARDDLKPRACDDLLDRRQRVA